MFVKRFNILIALVLMLTIALAACQPAAPEAPAEEEAPAAEEAEAPAEEEMEEGPKETIKFADTQFQSLWINNEIAMFIIEHGYGYPVDSLEMTTPIAQQSLADGEVDVWMELWRANWYDMYVEMTEAGKIVDLGNTYERSVQAWYVPRYVVEGDEERGIDPMAPDLKSISDLPQYWELFKDPEDPNKGAFISCITGWQCAEINRVKFYAYGLDEYYNIIEPGSSGALDAAIAGAYMKGNPVFTYYWEPTWLIGLYDMIMLEEPEYTDECWAEIDEIRQGVVDENLAGEVPESAGCHYETLAISKGVNSALPDRAPELVEFLKAMDVGTDALNKTAGYMTSEEVDASDAAAWFFENYEDKWRSWVPEDVAEKVAAALQ